ncbi:hypothetical protein [Myxococcus sp. XM-1-1-1]|uniref:hypothetical protein n=1 Tax=Myxococcus sp. XM-1-1-1 TaxID=2874602 RepID=UPI0038B387F5
MHHVLPPLAVMPEGVEHAVGVPLMRSNGCTPPLAVMPEGVEHHLPLLYRYRNRTTVPLLAMMPEGVEHLASSSQASSLARRRRSP